MGQQFKHSVKSRVNYVDTLVANRKRVSGKYVNKFKLFQMNRLDQEPHIQEMRIGLQRK